MTNDHGVPMAQENWDEESYLLNNPDVAEAVQQRQFKSGYEHFQRHGKYEGRLPGHPTPTQDAALPNGEDQDPRTRLCLDPWQYLEVSARGEVRPCCVHRPLFDLSSDESANVDIRNSAPFRNLRAQLLAGDLAPDCQKCHIRPYAATSALRAALDEMRKQDPSTDLLASAPLKQLRIDVNEACNLRCTYCAVSQPGYVGHEMTAEIFTRAARLITPDDPDLEVNLNGHGETTYHPLWREFATAILDTGARVHLLTNFAKPLSNDEIATLARMEFIQISLDTLDTRLLKSVRRQVSLGTILTNLHQVRVEAAKRNLKPIWGLSCGIYDMNVHGLVDLAWFAVTGGFKGVTFWNLVEYPAVEGPGSVTVKPISQLPDEARLAAYEAARAAVTILKDHQVPVWVAGDFLSQEQSGVGP